MSKNSSESSLEIKFRRSLEQKSQMIRCSLVHSPGSRSRMCRRIEQLGKAAAEYPVHCLWSFILSNVSREARGARIRWRKKKNMLSKESKKEKNGRSKSRTSWVQKEWHNVQHFQVARVQHTINFRCAHPDWRCGGRCRNRWRDTDSNFRNFLLPTLSSQDIRYT